MSLGYVCSLALSIGVCWRTAMCSTAPMCSAAVLACSSFGTVARGSLVTWQLSQRKLLEGAYIRFIFRCLDFFLGLEGLQLGDERLVCAVCFGFGRVLATCAVV